MNDIINNAGASRYELTLEGATARADYVLDGDVITFTHTIVPPELEGRGIGSRLIAAALKDVREKGLKIVPQCSFVAHYIDSHPEEADLLV